MRYARIYGVEATPDLCDALRANLRGRSDPDLWARCARADGLRQGRQLIQVAGGELLTATGPKRGRFAFAPVEHVGTSRMKAASARHVDGTGRITPQRNRFAPICGIRRWRRIQEGSGVRMRRTRK